MMFKSPPKTLTTWLGSVKASINLKHMIKCSYGYTNYTSLCNRCPEEACYKQEYFSKSCIFVCGAIITATHSPIYTVTYKKDVITSFYHYYNTTTKYRDQTLNPYRPPLH